MTDTAIISISDRRLYEMAKQIAIQVDPQAGGYFRQKLERAALLAFEAAKSSPHIPASGDR